MATSEEPEVNRTARVNALPVKSGRQTSNEVYSEGLEGPVLGWRGAQVTDPGTQGRIPRALKAYSDYVY